MLRLPARDGNISLVQRQGHRSRHVGLRFFDKRVQGLAQRRKPKTEVDKLRVLESDMLLEVCDVTLQAQCLELAMCGNQQCPARGLIATARFYPHKAVLG